MVLELKQGIIYGPVNSRRYGKSLGINLMPTEKKLCSFNCVYCHYGTTNRCTMNIDQYSDELPEVEDVVNALEDALKTDVELDLITFSGEEVADLRGKYRPDARIALLSNSTGLIYADVIDSLDMIDLPILKLDAGNEDTFRAINRPTRSVKFEEIFEKLFSLDGIYLQTVLVDGEPSNIGRRDLKEYIDRVGRIKPQEVHLYSIDRPVPNTPRKRGYPRKHFMVDLVLLYAGGAIPFLWGVAHLFPTASVVKGFGDISVDNKNIITMEWVTAIDVQSAVSKAVYILSAGGLIMLAIVSLFTGYKVNFPPFKLCPFIFTASALLIIIGGVL
jgi:wyosine [tRNA(Phe)-imidazoG37] synthetase (radical SAM superfamily)